MTRVMAADIAVPVDDAVALPVPLPVGLARGVVGTFSGWLDAPTPYQIASDTDSWSAAIWPVAQRLISIHGLAPHLVASGAVSGSGVPAAVPEDVAGWLIEQSALNAARLERIHGEMAALLAAAGRAGVAVMPLKGAHLTTLLGYRRPMSDIDILVRPADREAASSVLSGLGYGRIDQANPRPTHDVFLQPGSRVVSIDEHPDNPRRIELHTEVVRHLWGWFETDELTQTLWARATSQTVLGEQAFVAHDDDLLLHLAVHASSDLLEGRGRLVQWIDIARLARTGSRVSRPAHERVAYLALALAERTSPGSIPADDLAALESRVPRGLARSVNSAPLDDRSGLFLDYVRSSPSSMSERWQRWRPSRRRLWAAYGDAPLPVGLLRHARRLLHVATHRGRRSTSS
ncbi:MAG: nucleotidyltransferase family protein [Candidatus Limnocylindrales bacterium]